MKLELAGLIALGFACSGCASIVQGTLQSIGVSSSPSGAHCDINVDSSHRQVTP